MTTQTSTTLRFALLLTAVGGYLDAYAFVTRDGVFANAQTGNVVLMSIDLSEGSWREALAHLYPVLAFVAGIAIAMQIKSGRAERHINRPIRWAMAIQALLLTAVGFIPTTVHNGVVTVPIAFITAMQLGLFRQVGELAYMSIATTGNLMRLTEAGYTAVVDRDAEAKHQTAVYAAICGVFAFGAVLGAVLSLHLGARAAWVPAALITVALIMFYVDEHA